MPQGSLGDGTCPGDAGCRVAPVVDDGATRDVLVRGFRVARLQLRNIHDPDVTAAQFQWTPPKHAWIAKCALFVCMPVVVDGEIRNATGTNGCILAEQTMKPVPDTLDVRDLEYEMTEAAKPREDKFTALRYGCWVYDKARLIAATSLERVSASAVPGIEEHLKLSCLEASPREACAVPQHDSLVGRCAAQRCLRICGKDGDCSSGESLPRASDAGLLPDGGFRIPEGPSCRDAGPLSLCFPPEEG